MAAVAELVMRTEPVKPSLHSLVITYWQAAEAPEDTPTSAATAARRRQLDK